MPPHEIGSGSRKRLIGHFPEEGNLESAIFMDVSFFVEFFFLRLSAGVHLSATKSLS